MISFKWRVCFLNYSLCRLSDYCVTCRKHYGYETFDLIAHDRGARVAHRLCLDHPQAVRNLMTLDIAPTLFMFENTDQEFATKYWYVQCTDVGEE